MVFSRGWAKVPTPIFELLCDLQSLNCILQYQFGIHTLREQESYLSELGIGFVQPLNATLATVTDPEVAEIAKQNRFAARNDFGHIVGQIYTMSEQRIVSIVLELTIPDISAIKVFGFTKFTIGILRHYKDSRIRTAVCLLYGIQQVDHIVHADFSALLCSRADFGLMYQAKRLADTVTYKEGFFLGDGNTLFVFLRNICLQINAGIRQQFCI